MEDTDSSKIENNFSISMRNSVEIPLNGISSTTTFMTFKHKDDNRDQFAIRFSGDGFATPLLVRIHSECVTGDLFGSARCDCGDHLNYGLRCLDEQGEILIYLRQEGRGIDLKAKLDLAMPFRFF